MIKKDQIKNKNPIAEDNFQWIFARDGEGTEPLRNI
jgi:hypothetical protein